MSECGCRRAARINKNRYYELQQIVSVWQQRIGDDDGLTYAMRDGTVLTETGTELAMRVSECLYKCESEHRDESENSERKRE